MPCLVPLHTDNSMPVEQRSIVSENGCASVHKFPPTLPVYLSKWFAQVAFGSPHDTSMKVNAPGNSAYVLAKKSSAAELTGWPFPTGAPAMGIAQALGAVDLASASVKSRAKASRSQPSAEPVSPAPALP